MSPMPFDRPRAASSPETDTGATSNNPTLQELQRALSRAAEDLNTDLRKLSGATESSVSPAAAASPVQRLLNDEHSAVETAVDGALEDQQALVRGRFAPSNGTVAIRYVEKRWHTRSGVRLFFLLWFCVLSFGVGRIIWLSTRPVAQAGATSPLIAADTPTALPVFISTAAPTLVPDGPVAPSLASASPTIAPTSTTIIAASPTSRSMAVPAVFSPGVPATATRTAVTARTNVITFSAYQTTPDNAQIVMMRPDGSNRRVVSTLPGHPWTPKLSPDGKQILFSSGAPPKTGRAIDIDLNGSGSPDILVANIDGTQVRRLTNVAAGYNGWSWSPDGHRITFASNRDGGWSIYVMTAAGEQLTRLTNTPAQDGWPVWTADGAGFVFASTRSDQSQLYRMDANGTNIRRLLSSPTADTEPAIAPGIGRIAYSAQTTQGGAEIFVAERDGTKPRQLTMVGGLNSEPTWSPDGMQVVFVNHRDGRSDLYIVNVDGSGLLRLTNTGDNRHPDWSKAATGHTSGNWTSTSLQP